jgi:putative transport protein
MLQSSKGLREGETVHWLINALREHPEVSLFLVLALGYGFGSLNIGTFKLGPVLGVLIAGIVIGQLDIPISEPLKSAFFMMFLFAIGYRSGPQFFRSLRSTGPRQVVLTLVVCIVAFALSLVAARLCGFDAGTSGGLLAGALTGSAAFGAAGAAILRLNAGRETHQLLLSNGAMSFAVCYLIGTVLVIWILTKVGPRLMRVDLAKACSELEREMGPPQNDPEMSSAGAPFVMRAYSLPETLDGTPVKEIEADFREYRVFVQGLRRNGVVTTPATDERLRTGDSIALWGRREALIGSANALSAYEVDDRGLLNLGIVSTDIVVTRRKAGRRSLGELAHDDLARGVFLRKLVRAGCELPYTLQTSIEPGDILSVTGEESHTDRLAKELGYERQLTDVTNLTLVSGAIFLGALIGLPALALGGIEIGLTLFVGVLIGGLLLGWLSSRFPKLGRIPEPALWLFDSLGLAGFLALVGMQAGPGFVRGLRESGVALVVSAIIVVIVPHVVGILLGHYLLGMHPGIVLGACAGAGTSAPALGAVLETAHSRVPALSYGVGYALGNVVLALGGSLIVIIIGSG